MSRGFITVQVLFGLLLVTLLGGLILFLPVTQQKVRPPSEQAVKWLERYHGLLERLNTDLRLARQVQVQADSLEVTDAGGEPVLYRFQSGSFERQVRNQPAYVFMSGLKSGSFFRGQLLPNLISVLLVPDDTQAPPFFTSFSLRGGSQ